MASSKHPGNDVLRELVSQSGMTFAKMARELAVDRKTVRRWCRDIGINECGTNQSVSVTIKPENVTNDDKNVTEAELIIKDYQPVDPTVKALLNKVSWLIEWHTLLHDRLKAIEDAMSGAACIIPGELVELQVDEKDDFRNFLAEIVNKIETGQAFTDEEKVFIDNFTLLCRASTKYDLDFIRQRLENHYHTTLSINDTKVFFEGKRLARENRGQEL